MTGIPLDPEIALAFRCEGPQQTLAGGEGRSIQAGPCVLKPVEDIPRYNWACDVLRKLPNEGFRTSKPWKAINGSYVYRNWGASTYEPGESVSGRWQEKLAVSRLFHAQVNALDLPLMPRGDDVWSRAHELAWQITPLPRRLHPQILDKVEALFAHYRSLTRPHNVIHADICGNILFHETLPPCIIDFSPAYGSIGYAEAILIADAIAWEHAPIDFVDMLPASGLSRQHLLRAINFRLLAAALRDPDDIRSFLHEYYAFEPLIKVVFL